MKIQIILATTFALMSLAFSSPSASRAPARPRLVLVLVIDQFRADYLTRFESRFSKHGFKSLIAQGAYYPLAEYQHLQCVTAAGHAAILTGSLPYQNGITTNEWFDGTTGKEVYCVEDPKDGISPRNLIGTTVGDELKNAGFASKVVGIALKDRAAVLMAGHRADLALWFANKTFQWTSSSYYLGAANSLPKWVTALNTKILPTKGSPYQWKSPTEASGLSLRTSEGGSGFSHATTIGSRESLAYPLGVELTEGLAEAAISGMELGRDAAPDLLAVSFSSHDYLGHKHGPNSREMEELTVAEDRAIGKLLKFIDAQVPGGLRETLIVLTGDHGAPPATDWLTADHKFDAGKIRQEEVMKKLEADLTARFGPPPRSVPWISGFSDLAFFINPAVLAPETKPAYTRADLQAAMKETLSQIPGGARVVTGSEVEKGVLPPGILGRQVAFSYFAGRSGDATLIPKPYFAKEDGYLVEHVTGYSYDRTVPLILVGPGIKKGVYPQKAYVNDIAPTLSFVLRIIPPALNEGRVLSEIF